MSPGDLLPDTANTRPAARFVRELRPYLRPTCFFAIRVAGVTLLLGLSRWVDFNSVRADIAASDTLRPTMLAVFDAFDSVLRAAEEVGSSSVAAGFALALTWLIAVVAVALCLVSIWVSPSSLRSPRLRRSLAVLPRRMVREIFAVLIACGILARVAGRPEYLLNPYMWMNAALIALVMGMTVLAEQRWMCAGISLAAAGPPATGAVVAGLGSTGIVCAAAGSARGGSIDLKKGG